MRRAGVTALLIVCLVTFLCPEMAKPNVVTFEPTQAEVTLGPKLPVLLVVLGGLLLLALAANERWCGQLGLPTSPGSGP